MKRLCVVAALLAAQTACGPDPAAPKAPTDAGAVSTVSEDATPADAFVFNSKKEDALDKAALASASAKQAVVSLYFGNSMPDMCVKWNIHVTGADAVLADASALDQDVQGLLKDDGDGNLAGKFQTNGLKPGIRLLATVSGKVTVKGTMARCNSKDQTDVNATISVAQRALKDAFADTDDAGNLANLKARVTVKN